MVDECEPCESVSRQQLGVCGVCGVRGVSGVRGVTTVSVSRSESRNLSRRLTPVSILVLARRRLLVRTSASDRDRTDIQDLLLDVLVTLAEIDRGESKIDRLVLVLAAPGESR